MKGRCGGLRSKPYHSSLGKEGFALPGRDGGRQGRGGGLMSRTGRPLRQGWGDGVRDTGCGEDWG